jgi:hypothetical protein
MAKFCSAGLLLLSSVSPALGMEAVIKDWQRDRHRQPAPQEQRVEYNEPGKTELHGATTENACYKMEQTFKRQGRKLRLIRVDRLNNPGAVLRFLCIFEGEDAQTGYFDENRY